MSRSSVAVVFIVTVGFVCGITIDERLNELERIVIIQADKLETVQNENNILKNRVEIFENLIEQLNTIRAEYVGNKSNPPAAEDDQQLLNKDVHKRRDASVRSGENEFYLQENPQRRQLPSSNVAFHAHLLEPTCLHDHEVLVFGVEGIDVGNGYNKDDGMYVVPITGTYVFNWKVNARASWFVSDIMVNGHAKGSVVVDSSTDNEVAQATGLIIIHVVAGDHVYIRRSVGDKCNMHDTGPYATFSGWLIF